MGEDKAELLDPIVAKYVLRREATIKGELMTAPSSFRELGSSACTEGLPLNSFKNFQVFAALLQCSNLRLTYCLFALRSRLWVRVLERRQVSMSVGSLEARAIARRS
eukprot:Pompholyxophrys_punicea_v1_NODE_291_length_2358_cov_10.265740.p2 type:complete len:107 gc:universal NODE_291_length_2358_cov_10.265740:1389-1069(-)